MIKSESITKLAISLAKFQGEITNPLNTANNPFFNSKYAPLSDILALVRPVLAKYGLSVLQMPTADTTTVTITTILLHESGEFIESDPLTLKTDKATAQGCGSAITYARRYAIASILGISSEDDDDGNTAEGKQNKGKQEYKEPKIDAKKAQSIYILASQKGISTEMVKIYLNSKYKTNSAKELTEKQFEEMTAYLNTKPNKEVTA